MVRKGNVPILLSVLGWLFLFCEEVGALVYHQTPLLPARLFVLIMAGLIVLNAWTSVRSVLAPLRAAGASAVDAAAANALSAGGDGRKERGASEPSTGDLAFGLGREFERNLNGSGGNGHRLRAVSERP